MKRKFISWALSVFCGIIMLTLVSCKKDKQTDSSTPAMPHPEIEYINLGNTIIKADAPGFSIDVNHDGRKDLAFITLLVGDHLDQVDKIQFLITYSN